MTRTWDAVAHSSSLIVAVIASVAVGKPLGWIAFLLPLGPLLVVGAMRLTGREPRGWRSLVAFTIAVGLLIGVSWLGTQAGEFFSPLAYVFPLALLAFTLGVVNYVLVVVSRTIRAIKFDAFDYPWVPDRLARLVGLPPQWVE